jgi:hypothetical protein
MIGDVPRGTYGPSMEVVAASCHPPFEELSILIGQSRRPFPRRPTRCPGSWPEKPGISRCLGGAARNSELTGRAISPRRAAAETARSDSLGRSQASSFIPCSGASTSRHATTRAPRATRGHTSQERNCRCTSLQCSLGCPVENLRNAGTDGQIARRAGTLWPELVFMSLKRHAIIVPNLCGRRSPLTPLPPARLPVRRPSGASAWAADLAGGHTFMPQFCH